jgi:hypothetical protein
MKKRGRVSLLFDGLVNDMPIGWVISDDCRVCGQDLWVGEICAHVRVPRVVVGMLYVFSREKLWDMGCK